MKISNHGLALIKEFEELRLNVYLDKAGVPTIGYGSTRYENGTKVKLGDKLHNEAEASGLLIGTISPYEAAVNRGVKVPITQNQYDALVSFTYNEGEGAFGSSTLLRLLNKKDYKGASAQFAVWNKITNPKTKQHEAWKPLTERRAREAALFNTK